MITRKTARISSGIIGLLAEGLLLAAYLIETASRPVILSMMVLIGATIVVLVARK